jgi:glyoxylase-like metal-dependent hydrolase (beta-lactamase superfamily II)
MDRCNGNSIIGASGIITTFYDRLLFNMKNGIKVRILGDFAPFSMMGKSIGYEVTIGDSIYLVDCGAPLFQQIGGTNLKNIKGIIVTHCHDDHKRWFTDICLFHRYGPQAGSKVFLLTSEEVRDELFKSSRNALDRGFSADSKTIIDIPIKDYVTDRVIGPRARYRLVSEGEGKGKTGFYISDHTGNLVGPDVAKLVISEKTGRPRMLFKDPYYKEWIEPDSFYPFSSNFFYEEDKNIFKSLEGFSLEAIKSPVWHSITNIGIKIRTDNETLVFSSDTVHNTELWTELYQEKRPQNLNMSKSEFEQASVINGDINDYIERIWSEERYNEAVSAFHDSIVIHDISCGNSEVHTDYEKLHNTVLKKNRTILTQGPDRFVSEWPLCFTDKIFRINGNDFFEEANGRLYPMNADVYMKSAEQFFVGYRNEKGKYMVYEKTGLLKISEEENDQISTPLYRVDLYEDISGRYFPKIENENEKYMQRNDGRVELVEFSESGSRGRIVEDLRNSLSKGLAVELTEKQILS